MEHEELRAHLEELHRELSQTPNLDERGQQLLETVRADLARLDATTQAETPEAATGERAEIQTRWQTAVADFENSHPQLAQGLERMAVILGNFGL